MLTLSGNPDPSSGTHFFFMHCNTRPLFRRAWLVVLSLSLGLAAWTAPAAVSGTKSALVMLVSLTDAPIDCTIAEVNGFWFTNSPLNVDSYYDHSTWGSVRWTGAVITVSVAFSKTPCNADAWANAADAAAVGMGYNPSAYTARVYAFPSAAGSCGYALATGNRVMTWHGTDLFAYGHEVGHTIGMHHASTDHDNNGVIEDEYGGLDDCMGGESYTFNAPHKVWGGWLPLKTNTVNVSGTEYFNGGWRPLNTNGNYQLSALEINPTNVFQHSQVVKISPPTGIPYFLSFRRPLDYDAGWTAAQVGKDGRTGTIVDPVPPITSYPYANGVTIHRHNGGTGSQTLEIAVLRINQQFVIPGTGITIRQTAVDANRVALDITGVGGGVAANGVTFYEDDNYGGGQSQIIPAGNYNLSQLIARGVPNDWASSCKIPPGWTVAMYQNDNFTGTSWTNTVNIPDFSTLVPAGANNNMSSCRITAGPVVIPVVPADLSAVGGDARVGLLWTPSPGATSYNLKRSTVNGGPYTTIGTTNISGFVDFGVTNGTTYYYVASAVNGAGESANSAQVSTTPTGSLVAHWKFNENVGSTTADSTGNGNLGSLLNTPTWVAGKMGAAALLFSASSLESVTAADSPTLNNPVSAITISAWVNAIDWTGNRRIVQKGNTDNQYRLLAEGGVLKFHLNGVDSLTAPLPPVGTWVHIAATWDGSTMILYTNGVQQTSLSAGGTIATTADLLAIGKKNGSGVAGDYFNGRLDEVRIYNRAISPAEIALIMTNSPPTFAADPFAKPAAIAGQAYGGTIATNAADPNGDTITFSKLSGPAWLTVAANGGLSGAPANPDADTNAFVVSALDSTGMSNNATMNIFVNGTPSFVSDPFALPDMIAGQEYAGTLATNASDPNALEVLTFAKLSGPPWLSVATDGSVSGFPYSENSGTNSFIVSVTDSTSLSNVATMTLYVAPAPAMTATLSVQGSDLLLSWNGGIGPYLVQMTTNLVTGPWEDYGFPEFTNSVVITRSNSEAFYRILGL